MPVALAPGCCARAPCWYLAVRAGGVGAWVRGWKGLSVLEKAPMWLMAGSWRLVPMRSAWMQCVDRLVREVAKEATLGDQGRRVVLAAVILVSALRHESCSRLGKSCAFSPVVWGSLSSRSSESRLARSAYRQYSTVAAGQNQTRSTPGDSTVAPVFQGIGRNAWRGGLVRRYRARFIQRFALDAT